MSNWISEWARKKWEIAERLAAGECGGSYGEAALILCSVLNALAAGTWKGDHIDRRRFVELLQQYAPANLHPTHVSLPLLVGALREAGRSSEMNAMQSRCLRGGHSRVLIGEDIDLDEARILAICPTIPTALMRECSYANVLYRDVRSGYAHEYRPGKRAESWPMTQGTEVAISYVNWANDPDRHIHFHVPWLGALVTAVSQALDPIADSLPLTPPVKWWVDA